MRIVKVEAYERIDHRYESVVGLNMYTDEGVSIFCDEGVELPERLFGGEG